MDESGGELHSWPTIVRDQKGHFSPGSLSRLSACARLRNQPSRGQKESRLWQAPAGPAVIRLYLRAVNELLAARTSSVQPNRQVGR